MKFYYDKSKVFCRENLSSPVCKPIGSDYSDYYRKKLTVHCQSLQEITNEAYLAVLLEAISIPSLERASYRRDELYVIFNNELFIFSEDNITLAWHPNYEPSLNQKISWLDFVSVSSLLNE